MQHKVGYTGGINKDLARDKYTNTNYFDANNIKIITAAGSSTGSVENEQGNKELFRFPTVGARYKVTIASGTVVIDGNSIVLSGTESIEEAYDKILAVPAVATLIDANDISVFFNDSGVFIQVLDTSITVTGSVTIQSPATSTIYICGWCRLNEFLIVFTSDSETAEPTNALCQIWKFKFQSGSRTQIDGASGTTLVASEHLIYNDYLNYSTETYIRDTVTNYETSSKGRVYWTDYFNQIRVANVFDTELMATKATDLGLISEVTLSQPVIQDITNVTDGLSSGAHYQSFYKLLSTDGRETIFSPGSQLIDVQNNLSSDTSVNYFDLDSTPANTANNKALTVEINDVDTDFDVIELYLVQWNTLDSPIIYFIDDFPVTGSTMEFLINSVANAITITAAEFMQIGIPFTAKTIEDRDKVLVAGNIKETKFDLDFDTRAYRFNSSSTFDLFDGENNIEYSGLTTANYSDIAEDADAINPTNDDANINYNFEAANRQIYKADGSTIGGEGPFVSYEFKTNAREGSAGSNALRDTGAVNEGYNISTQRVGISQTSFGTSNLDGNDKFFSIENEFANTKSARMNAILTGYARGEVYRFGIVFYSKAGQRSFVKWIGDIKFPDPTLGDAYKIADSNNATTNVREDETDTNTTVYSLGIRFSIDISTIQENISGFEIVRVKRTESDKTRLGTGIVTNFVDYHTGSPVNPNNNGRTLVRKYANHTSNYYPGSTFSKSNWSQSSRAIDTSLQLGTTTYGDSETTTGPRTNANLMLADHPTFFSETNGSGITSDYQRLLLNFTSPLSEFRSYTNFSINSSTDFIRDYGYYSCEEYIYNDDDANGEQSANLSQVSMGFLFRAKQFSSLASQTVPQTAQNYRIAASRYLEDGECIFNDGSNAEDTALLGNVLQAPVGTGNANIELVANTSYTFYNSDNAVPFGLGTAKQFLRLDTTSTDAFITSGTSLNVKSATDNAAFQGTTDYFKEVAYCREVPNQYGGNTFQARSKNTYITTGTYQIINNQSASSYTFDSYGGDTYVLSYARQYMRMYFNNITDIPFKDSIGTKLAIGFIFCCESGINTAWRTGIHFGGEDAESGNNYFRGSISTDLTKGDQSIAENFIFDDRHTQQNNIRTDYIAKDFLAQSETIFPNRIKVSERKLDGELTDSWRKFPVNQFDDVDGSYGEINKLLAFKGQVIYFQDRAIGVIPINERSLIQDSSGAELVLGDGNIIGKYNYITETSGTKHQHSVVSSDRAAYYYDSLQQKIYQLQGDAITEALGLHDFFHNNIKEIVRDSDDLYKSNPIGVHSVYDKKNERVLFTLLGANEIKTTSGYYSVGDIISVDSDYYQCLVQGDYLTTDVTSTNTNFELLSNYVPGVTLGFRERLNAFESFYSYRPGNFLNFDDKLLSISPATRNYGYVHEEGDYNTFYENSHPSDITLTVMPNPNIIAIFNNLEYYSEVTIDKKDIVDSTLDSILCYNDYQNTGEITLSVGTIAKRRIRTWRHQIKRDILNNNLNSISNPRMRNYFLLMKLKFDTSTNERLVLSDVVISYTPTRM